MQPEGSSPGRCLVNSALFSALVFVALAQPLPDDAEPVEFEQVASVDAFVPNLAPYGDWVWLDGQRVFRPAESVVGADFVPYASHGRWVSTEAGWSFSSSLPFGWATFHYGRWWFDERLGWVWLPDTTWGPAWVDWRFGGGYAGWAPLPPPRFVYLHRPRWFFVQAPYFGAPNLFLHAVPRARYESVMVVAVPVPTRHWRGSVWYAGPAYRDVVHVAVAAPERRSMRAFAPPPEFHPAVPAGSAPMPPPPRSNVPPPPQQNVPPPPRQNVPPPPRSNVAPPMRQSVPPPVRMNAPPPVRMNAPPPVRMNAPPPMRMNAPPPMRMNPTPSAPPPPQKRNAVPPPPNGPPRRGPGPR